MKNMHTLLIQINKHMVFFKSLVFKKQIFFLENKIYKNEGTKLFLLTISYTASIKLYESFIFLRNKVIY